MAAMPKLYARRPRAGGRIGPMLNNLRGREVSLPPMRPITVMLTEDEWRELMQVESNPVEWLRDVIHQRLQGQPAQAAAKAPLGN